VVAFAATIGIDWVAAPWTIHSANPTVNDSSETIDRSPADFVRQVLTICGTNAAVVSVAAT
jgi:hypothetical protein